VTCDGCDPLKVATRIGILHLPRQVCYNRVQKLHTLPANTLLPPHAGMLITRGLQEWACLFSVELAFAPARRLLGWVTQEAKVLSTTQLRTLVREHGQQIRQAEQEEVACLQRAPEPTGRAPALRPAAEPRRPAAWPAEQHTIVAAALAEASPAVPDGVLPADWERVLAVRGSRPGPPDVAALARLGPEIEGDQVIVAVDEVLVREPEKGRFAELRTARVATRAGYRYLSGTGERFLAQLEMLIRLCVPQTPRVTLLADGGRWIRAFFAGLAEKQPGSEFILDWYHLTKKCKDRLSRLGRGKRATRALVQTVLKALWQGEVAEAVTQLEAVRGEAREEQPLDELTAYLRARESMIPNYRQRRASRQYVGSGQAEKANDLLVARRQKQQGMHWKVATSDGLAALKTLMLNHEWDLYWEKRQVPSLVAA
jgi:hypothetical protein